MIVAEEDTSATIFLIFFHNHPVKSIDFLSLCEKTNLFSFLFLNGKEFCEMGFARKDVEATKKMEKKFVRYPEGAEKYSLGLTKFQALAKEAKAVYKIDKVALVNCEIFEKYLETFCEEDDTDPDDHFFIPRRMLNCENIKILREKRREKNFYIFLHF